MNSLVADQSRRTAGAAFANSYSPTTAIAHGDPAEYRRRVYTLVRKYQLAVTDPRGRQEALDLLRLIHIRLETYFAMANLLDDSGGRAESAVTANSYRAILQIGRAHV